MKTQEKPQNILGAIKQVLSSQGSTWCDIEAIAKRSSLSGMDDLIKERKVIYYEKDGMDLFTLPLIHDKENRLAHNVARIRNADRATFDPEQIAKLIAEGEKATSRQLCDEQMYAVKTCVSNMLTIITGGPGTGKTTVLNIVDYVMRKLGFTNIIYTAPTGKAARRISESTGKKASTLHKMLGVVDPNDIPDKICCDAIIVDEVSMLDLDIADALFQAVCPGTKVILVGDTDQLPSVGIGSILRDFIASGMVPVARLVKTFRQSGDSMIFRNMGYIRKGEPILDTGEDFMIACPTEKYSAVDEILMIYKAEYERLGGNDQLCLLTPFRKKKYETSSEALNEKLQQMVNPKGASVTISDGTIFRKGDPVMQLRNRKEVANGDVGRIIGVSEKAGSIQVQYVDCTVSYSNEELEDGELALAYAMSIHKSQGSEYASVITCLLDDHGPMLQRNLLYTAITRAKKNVFLVCDQQAVVTAITHESTRKRRTLLAEKLSYFARTEIQRV